MVMLKDKGFNANERQVPPDVGLAALLVIARVAARHLGFSRETFLEIAGEAYDEDPHDTEVVQ
jgi:hypothetical protein